MFLIQYHFQYHQGSVFQYNLNDYRDLFRYINAQVNKFSLELNDLIFEKAYLIIYDNKFHFLIVNFIINEESICFNYLELNKHIE